MSPPEASLRDLIDKALARHDLKSINALAKLGREAGFSITQTTLWKIHDGSYKSSPKPATLEALAYLAGVSYSTAHEVAGLDPPGRPFVPAPGADKLTNKERDAVNGVIRALLEARSLGQASDTNPNGEHATQASVAYLTDADLDHPYELPPSVER